LKKNLSTYHAKVRIRDAIKFSYNKEDKLSLAYTINLYKICKRMQQNKVFHSKYHDSNSTYRSRQNIKHKQRRHTSVIGETAIASSN